MLQFSLLREYSYFQIVEIINMGYETYRWETEVRLYLNNLLERLETMYNACVK